MVYSRGFADRVLREHVQKPYAIIKFLESWRNLPEIPTSEEILEDVSWQEKDGPEQPMDYQRLAEPKEFDPRLPHNNIDGAWGSKEEYLGFHYQILREDAVAPLRQSVAEFKRNSNMSDTQDTSIYTDVHLVGLQLSHLGPAFRIEFSSDKAGKRIRWEQSSRLTQGSLVCLSPTSDKFRSICKVGTVAARPIEGGLDCDPPQVDLFFGDDEDIILNPTESYIMIQSRVGFFEAYRHVLVALQKLATEDSPYIQKYLIEMDRDILPPDHIKERPCLDLRSIALSSGHHFSDLTDEEDETLCHVDVLKEFPILPKSGMDDSQLAACKRMLTQSLAIVQGPPGTGKTFTSVQALKAMLCNRGNGPVIVAAQTNHALDQLLTHIAGFEEKFVRLGSRCDKKNSTILARTLYELREEHKKLKTKQFNGGVRSACKAHNDLVESIELMLFPVIDFGILPARVLLESGVMSQEHYDSFFEPGWCDSGDTQDENVDPLESWLGAQKVRMPRTPVINKHLEIEDPDQEFDQLQESEVEVQANDVMDALNGTWIPFSRSYTGKTLGARAIGKNSPKNILARVGSLLDIPDKYRGHVYCYWEKLYYDQLTHKLSKKFDSYRASMNKLKMAKWRRDADFIDNIDTRVIGCTTTGLSKYRGLLSALNPSVLLIEEAAETLEANVTAGIIPSLEQVILVGDHRQLTANTTLDRFMSQPYYMSISLFERLVNNGMAYTMLNKQRRMIPEIRELLCIEPNPFYIDLHDHQNVRDRVNHRPPVPGMNFDSYFFSHKWQEHRDVNMSCYNAPEAEMVAGFFNYLVLNCIKPEKITVLTYYNGQRKLLLKELSRRVTSVATPYFKVYTVDAYQGEENEVILLSLVRGNPHSSVGFLRSKNRVVVALSRAQRGLYIFGNALTVAGQEADNGSRDKLWMPILLHLLDEKRFGSKLPILCSKHENHSYVSEPEHWEDLSGGCHEFCGGMLPCGHLCPYKCHPTPHDQVLCKEPCEKLLDCGHGCSNNCGQPCRCEECRTLDRMQALQLASSPKKITAENENGNNALNTTPAKQKERSPQKSWKLDQQIGQSNSYTQLSSGQSGGQNSLYTFAPSPTKRELSPEKGRQLWDTWDPVRSDKHIDQERLEREKLANENKPDSGDLVFAETHKPVRFENGKRIVGPKIQNVIPRVVSSNEITRSENQSPRSSYEEFRNFDEIFPSNKEINGGSSGVAYSNNGILRNGHESMAASTHNGASSRANEVYTNGVTHISNDLLLDSAFSNEVDFSNGETTPNSNEAAIAPGYKDDMLKLSSDDFDFLEGL
ncbi:putative dead box helicase protein [Botrytis fragariae]|uniref:Putative dead box helicase protein n=1 Tax=Botrytis fragariae TaxID=1964551 RepID=A0A8H6B0Q8_9HELO|nr:putative dead box helicase protein [Botrytis fragariae]KAF5877161.1 putative dead box helicase protein [Botrytis fragariae]